MRVAYLWPSGDVRSNRYASSFWALDPQATIEKSSNNGDLFVTESSLLLTSPDVVECFDPGRHSDRMVQKVNSEFDVIFIRGANTLSDEPYAGLLADFLEKTTLKVVTMGIGIQAPSRSKMPSGSGVRRLAAVLGERSAQIGVRGEITADFLMSNGVDNVRVVGCPSILRHNKRDLHVEKPDWKELHSFGFSLSRYYSNLYQRDDLIFLKVQSRLIKELHRAGRVGVISQVEKEEKAFAFRDLAAMETATESLRRSGWFDDEMEQIYRTRSVFFGTTASSYDMQVRNFDAVIGTRLHANAMAVACGVPAITIALDLRVEEIYEFWGLPCLSVEAAAKLSAREIYEQADFEPFNRRSGFIYQNFREYLEANGVAHRMNTAS